MARRRREPKIRNPFNYGDLVADESFTDRQHELKQLKSDIVNGQNVALIAPRRYGKSSLVRAALSDLIGRGVLVVEVDLMATPTKERLAGKLAKSIDSDIAPTVFKAKEHLRIFQSLRVAPIVTVDPDGSFGFSFSASRAPEEIDDTLERLLELPAMVAADKRKHVVVYFWLSMSFDLQTKQTNEILKKLYEQYGGKDGKLEVIGLNMDQTPEAAKKYVAKHAIPWSSAYLGDWSKTTVPSDWGLRTGGVFLVGPDGKLVARDLQGDAIRTTIEGAMKK